MCGIAGAVSLTADPVNHLARVLEVMNTLQAHRGPDGQGVYLSPQHRCGLAHRRLSIIDLTTGAQPFSHPSGVHLVFNGEIYNYIELRQELGEKNFRTTSDTEVIIQAYLKWGKLCLSRLRGMFAFALFDERENKVFIARDRVGIKPLYYQVTDGVLYFASEVKTLLPFLNEIAFDPQALKEYLTFQLYLKGRTLFKGVLELPAGSFMEIVDGTIRCQKYWEVSYHIDSDHSPEYFHRKLAQLLDESVAIHCRADVPVSAYVSGGVDSSLVSILASRHVAAPMKLFVGKFELGPEYDESYYARLVADSISGSLEERSITAQDFIQNIERVMYHLDYPVAGPGSFSQFMISETVARHRKVVLGGQGGDEIFGGYVRYLLAYFEQCIKGAIEGTLKDGQFLVTYESIIPNLSVLRGYKSMIQDFWRDGIFDPMDARYFKLVNRAPTLRDEIRWEALGDSSPFESFKEIFHAPNVGRKAYFEKMSHFDFETLLPALLHIEDRVSMAHGLESRVPLIDHEFVELAATAPPPVRFGEGRLKRLLVDSVGHLLPEKIRNRGDKMGFPTPITLWARNEANAFISDILTSKVAKERPYINHDVMVRSLFQDSQYGRKLWGLLSLELWSRRFLDRAHEFSSLSPQ